MTELSLQLTRLLENRIYGAVNIRGIRFQILYSILRAFDVYQEVESIRLEGLDDIDSRRSYGFSEEKAVNKTQYVQVKTSGNKWHWSNFTGSKIVDNFLGTWKADPTAEFLVVTNFAYADRLDELVKYCSGKKKELSKKNTTGS